MTEYYLWGPLEFTDSFYIAYFNQAYGTAQYAHQQFNAAIVLDADGVYADTYQLAPTSGGYNLFTVNYSSQSQTAQNYYVGGTGFTGGTLAYPVIPKTGQALPVVSLRSINNITPVSPIEAGVSYQVYYGNQPLLWPAFAPLLSQYELGADLNVNCGSVTSQITQTMIQCPPNKPHGSTCYDARITSTLVSGVHFLPTVWYDAAQGCAEVTDTIAYESNWSLAQFMSRSPLFANRNCSTVPTVDGFTQQFYCQMGQKLPYCMGSNTPCSNSCYGLCESGICASTASGWSCVQNETKPFWKETWFWVILVTGIIVIVAAIVILLFIRR